MSENISNQRESQKIYASMARLSSNEEKPIRKYGDILQYNNCILYSSAACHTTLYISDFIPESFLETDKRTKVSYGIFLQQCFLYKPK